MSLVHLMITEVKVGVKQMKEVYRQPPKLDAAPVIDMISIAQAFSRPLIEAMAKTSTSEHVKPNDNPRLRQTWRRSKWTEMAFLSSDRTVIAVI